MKVDVIIPTYRPDEKFDRLMNGLVKQAYPLNKIILMNTEESLFGRDVSVWNRRVAVEVHHLSKQEFDHAATRAKGASYSDADVIIYMTMDAVPVDDQLISSLVDALYSDERVAVAYARQLPDKNCLSAEREARRFNYPDQSRVKTREDLKTLGIKAFFCSDVCAAYKKDIFDELGGFVERAIFNEDMLYAHKALVNDYKIFYCAEARVIHSHNYTGIQQFHRNFDLGVSQKEYCEVFAKYPSEGEGMRMVLGQAQRLMAKGKLLDTIRLIYVSGCKYIGYQLGKHYDILPDTILARCTSNPGYFHQM